MTICFVITRRSRVTFDTSETKKMFGPIIVDFAQVQSKVNMKYDTWHKDVLSKFASRLGDNLQEFYGTVSKVFEIICIFVVIALQS